MRILTVTEDQEKEHQLRVLLDVSSSNLDSPVLIFRAEYMT